MNLFLSMVLLLKNFLEALLYHSDGEMDDYSAVLQLKGHGMLRGCNHSSDEPQSFSQS